MIVFELNLKAHTVHMCHTYKLCYFILFYFFEIFFHEEENHYQI